MKTFDCLVLRGLKNYEIFDNKKTGSFDRHKKLPSVAYFEKKIVFYLTCFQNFQYLFFQFNSSVKKPTTVVCSVFSQNATNLENLRSFNIVENFLKNGRYMCT